MSVLIDVKKAYDMVWKEGVMIRLNMIRIAGRTYNCVKEFLFNRFIQNWGSLIRKMYGR